MAGKILFVDDDANLLQSIKRSLRPLAREWEMSFALSGEEALALVESTAFDVVVADYKMPGMDGMELLSTIKARLPAVRTILMTGQSEAEVYERAKESVDHYLAKPCDNDKLIKLITK